MSSKRVRYTDCLSLGQWHACPSCPPEGVLLNITAPDEGGDAPTREEVGACAALVEAVVDKPIIMRENVHLGPFQAKIIKGKIKPLLGETTHVVIMPLKSGDTQPKGARPLPPGLHVLHAFTHLKNGSSKILGVEVQPEPMSVAVCQEKLVKKLNLDRLKNWSPMLAYHDIFALDSNKPGCTSVIEHEI